MNKPPAELKVVLVVAKRCCGMALVDDQGAVEEFAADAGPAPPTRRVPAGRGRATETPSRFMARAGTALVPHWKCVQPEVEQLDRGLVGREVCAGLGDFSAVGS